MQQQHPKPIAAPGGFALRDILFVLFKHKWKIVILTILGLAGSTYLYLNREPVYGSQAKLWVRYVVERSTVDTYDTPGGKVGSVGSHVLASEMEILRSADLSLDVAEKLGPERLVGPGITPSLDAAASRVQSGIQVSSPNGGNVIFVNFSHPDYEMAAVVLRALVQSYFERHLEIHRSLGTSEYVVKQADQARNRLRETEDTLKRIKAESGILSLAGSSDALEGQRGRIREAIMAAETQLVEQRARLSALEGGTYASTGSANRPDEDAPSAEAEAENLAAREEFILASAEYRDVAEQLSFLRARRNDLLSRYTPSNPLVSSTQRQILEAEAKRRNLMSRHPTLIAESAGSAAGSGGPDIGFERAQMQAIQARAEALRSQELEIMDQMEKISAVGNEIIALERRKAIDEEKYAYLESSLERARADAALDPSKMPNITMIESPTQPIKMYDKSTMNLIYGLAAGGLALGVGLAFLLELVIDPRVKRPAEIQTRLSLPLIMTIPHMRARKRERIVALDQTVPLLVNRDGVTSRSVPAPRGLASSHFMASYVQALRDRIIFNFGINNITHKPKIIGVTGLSAGAGASTIAGGIAKAFAEAPGMKVLLVDLNVPLDGKNPIYGKSQPLTLPGALQAAREQHFRESQQDLYYASANAGPLGMIPMQVHEMMPYIRFSDYDYIVFDMPPVHQTSPTLSMAGLMDKVLLVLDGDATSRDGLKWAFSELVRGRADVSCVFNKARNHAPKWVLGEI